jgi:hypothetical protein
MCRRALAGSGEYRIARRRCQGLAPRIDSSVASTARRRCVLWLAPSVCATILDTGIKGANMLNRVSSLALLVALLSACNAPAAGPAPAAETPLLVPTPTWVVEVAPSVPAASPTTAADLTSLDLCSLLEPGTVEAALGEAVTPSPGPGVCLYVGASGTQSVTLAALSGEAAKTLFLNTIAQLQSDCSVSFSTGSEATATPFPPEIQALFDRTLPELIDEQDRVQREVCGFIPTPEEYQRLDGLGEAAYFQVLNLGFVQAGAVIVVRGDSYLSVTFAAPTLDPIRARTIGETLAAEALLRLP